MAIGKIPLSALEELPGSGAVPNTWYVSSSGDDSNDGSSADKPFLTPQKAHDMATSGDVVRMTAGNYPAATLTKNLHFIGPTSGIYYTGSPDVQLIANMNGASSLKVKNAGVTVNTLSGTPSYEFVDCFYAEAGGLTAAYIKSINSRTVDLTLTAGGDFYNTQIDNLVVSGVTPVRLWYSHIRYTLDLPATTTLAAYIGSTIGGLLNDTCAGTLQLYGGSQVVSGWTDSFLSSIPVEGQPLLVKREILDSQFGFLNSIGRGIVMAPGAGYTWVVDKAWGRLNYVAALTGATQLDIRETLTGTVLFQSSTSFLNAGATRMEIFTQLGGVPITENSQLTAKTASPVGGGTGSTIDIFLELKRMRFS